jgi:hypothetical protein
MCSVLLPCNKDYDQWTLGIAPSDGGLLGGVSGSQSYNSNAAHDATLRRSLTVCFFRSSVLFVLFVFFLPLLVWWFSIASVAADECQSKAGHAHMHNSKFIAFQCCAEISHHLSP